jgi:hypothetical protein
MRADSYFLVSLIALGLIGCGDQNRVVQQRTTPPATTATPAPSATPTPVATPTATPTATATATPTATPTAEQQTGGAGAPDEESVQQRARFIVTSGGVSPAEVKVAPFLPVHVTVRNTSAQPVTVRPPEGSPRQLAAGQTFETTSKGLKRGRYPIIALEGGEGTLVVE